MIFEHVSAVSSRRCKIFNAVDPFPDLELMSIMWETSNRMTLIVSSPLLNAHRTWRALNPSLLLALMQTSVFFKRISTHCLLFKLFRHNKISGVLPSSSSQFTMVKFLVLNIPRNCSMAWSSKRVCRHKDSAFCFCKQHLNICAILKIKFWVNVVSIIPPRCKQTI